MKTTLVRATLAVAALGLIGLTGCEKKAEPAKAPAAGSAPAPAPAPAPAEKKDAPK